MADVFISYKRQDRAHAERIADLFAKNAISVWWDDDIRPREAWDATIEREISSASSVVVLWTPLSIASDWVRTEAHFAHERGKLVPVTIETCTPPLAFTLTQTVDLSRWSGDGEDRLWRKLLAWVADLKTAPNRQRVDTAPTHSFHSCVGKLASGEPVVDGAFVSVATPPGTLFRDGLNAPIMRVLPAGSFLLGGSVDDPDKTSQELPQKRIGIDRPFAIGIYPVTEAEYFCYGPALPQPEAKKSTWGSLFGRPGVGQATPAASGPRAPSDSAASSIAFEDATKFAAALSHAVSAAYRLPSEAEWEYACRAGSRSRFSWGDEIDLTRALYRWPGAQHTGPCAPGRFKPNGFGLYDVHGNVREWTEDLWHDSYESIPADGRAATDGYSSMRVTRGGGWSDPPVMVRSSARGRATQTIRSEVIGFRVVRSL